MSFASFDLHPFERALRTRIERATLPGFRSGSVCNRRADGRGRPEVCAPLSERRGRRARSGVGG